MKTYGEITDENVRRAMAEIQVISGNRNSTLSTRAGQFLTDGKNLYVCFASESKEWRKVILDD